MIRSIVAVAVVLSTVASAQQMRDRLERRKDRQDLRQDRRQGADDRLDAAQVSQLLRDYDSAMASSDVGRLTTIDQAFRSYLAREITESRVESAQKQQEVREDKREVRSDRRELRQDVALNRRPGVVADDVGDKARDRVNLADDRGDAARERLSRERLQVIDGQLASLSGRFDGVSVNQKRQLYAEVVGAAAREVAGDKVEQREDKRELREDRRETREDRRDPVR